MNECPAAVEFVDAQVVRPLRRAVLRPDQSAEHAEYPADDHPLSAHAAVRHPEPRDPEPRRPEPRRPEPLGRAHDADVVAVGSVLPEAPPWEPGRGDGWRVRGMATRPDSRRHGFGSLVLEALVHHVAAHGGGLVWCNARVPAQCLYARAGFVIRGEVFDIPGIGPHVHMWRTVAGDDGSSAPPL